MDRSIEQKVILDIQNVSSKRMKIFYLQHYMKYSSKATRRNLQARLKIVKNYWNTKSTSQNESLPK
jgi:hypothetical protein